MNRRICMGTAAAALGALLIAGCQGGSPTTTAPPPGGPPAGGPPPGGPPGAGPTAAERGKMRAYMGGPGGMGGGRMGGGRMGGGRMGGRMGGGPIAADLPADQVYKQLCIGCHGPKGEGGTGPALAAAAARAQGDLEKTIHDGKGRMPAFGARLSDAQVKAVAAYVKTLGS
jgi:hypothetical protein